MTDWRDDAIEAGARAPHIHYADWATLGKAAGPIRNQAIVDSGPEMTSTIDAIAIRRGLGRKSWGVPQQFGPDGWMFDHLRMNGRIIVTCAPHDGVEWLHASIAFQKRMPTYDEMKLVHWAVLFERWAYEVFAPGPDHVNTHQHARHLWARLDGKPALPDFTMGTGLI